MNSVQSLFHRKPCAPTRGTILSGGEELPLGPAPIPSFSIASSVGGLFQRNRRQTQTASNDQVDEAATTATSGTPSERTSLLRHAEEVEEEAEEEAAAAAAATAHDPSKTPKTVNDATAKHRRRFFVRMYVLLFAHCALTILFMLLMKRTGAPDYLARHWPRATLTVVSCSFALTIVAWFTLHQRYASNARQSVVWFLLLVTSGIALAFFDSRIRDIELLSLSIGVTALILAFGLLSFVRHWSLLNFAVALLAMAVFAYYNVYLPHADFLRAEWDNPSLESLHNVPRHLATESILVVGVSILAVRLVWHVYSVSRDVEPHMYMFAEATIYCSLVMLLVSGAFLTVDFDRVAVVLTPDPSDVDDPAAGVNPAALGIVSSGMVVAALNGGGGGGDNAARMVSVSNVFTRAAFRALFPNTTTTTTT
jgi:hypothetical protein